MNFRYAITLAQTLYDVEGDSEDLIEIGLVAYNFIGNKNTQLKKVMLDVDSNDGSVQLPCGTVLLLAYNLDCLDNRPADKLHYYLEKSCAKAGGA